MIVLKAAQEKVLSALQAVSGIVERRHTLPILAKPEVETVTVVEMNPHVIKLVEPCLRKRPESAKLTVIEADIFSWEPPKGMKWNFLYFDIWPNICTDNLEEMAKLHRKFARRKTSKSAFMDSWMRGSLQSQNRADKREEAKWGMYRSFTTR
jgi:hypothetical protein